MRSRVRTVALAVALAVSGIAFSQSCFTLRYFGLTVHPFGDDQASLQPYRLDDGAYFVANFGGLAGVEKYVWEDIVSIKALQGVFTDCSAGWAGISHLGFRGLLFEHKRHRLHFGMGPTLMYREDWNRMEDYKDSGFFHRRNTDRLGSVQYKFFWYGCEFEYDYSLNDKLDLNAGFTPGAPLALTFSIGVKYWVSKQFKISEKLVIPK